MSYKTLFAPPFFTWSECVLDPISISKNVSNWLIPCIMVKKYRLKSKNHEQYFYIYPRMPKTGGTGTWMKKHLIQNLQFSIIGKFRSLKTTPAFPRVSSYQASTMQCTWLEGLKETSGEIHKKCLVCCWHYACSTESVTQTNIPCRIMKLPSLAEINVGEGVKGLTHCYTGGVFH